MQVKAIKTDKGNYIAKYGNYYFYVGEDRKTLLRLTDEQEFQNALENWDGEISEQKIVDIKEIIELSAFSEKIGFHIDGFTKADLELLDVENFSEQFSYVNNDFNYVIGFYANGKYKTFAARCGGNGTSEPGNHGTSTSWEGDTYIETLKLFIIETGTYPELMIVEESDHESRQGDGYKSKVYAYILPSSEAIKAFFDSVTAAYEALKTMPITIY